MYCSNCGNKIIEETNFCNSCGNKIDTSQIKPSENKKNIYKSIARGYIIVFFVFVSSCTVWGATLGGEDVEDVLPPAIVFGLFLGGFGAIIGAIVGKK